MIETQRLERLKEALLSLAALPPDQRRDWIDRRLADDAGLREEVVSLLEAAGDAPSPELEPLFPIVERPESSGVLPRTIGPYTVESLLGEGGMATVYRARQEQPIERHVALKVLRPGTYTPALVARFMAERQTIARLEHRNIARLLDAGEDASGRPYVAMELVDGPSLTEYVRVHRLGLRERMGLFAQVCRGVQHAHARGFLHRDLKPSNILVAEEDAGPVPKVIDFGLAKSLLSDPRAARQTISGEVLGTVEYMSPEQASPLSPVPTVRCDVYSLGVIHYELLTGVLPFDEAQLRGKSAAEIHTLLTTVRPPAPSRRERGGSADGDRLDWTAPVDLDFVTLKAIDADPEGRYASVRELGDDVERWLRSEPVQARPPSRLYLARRFVRRNRLATGAAAIVLVAMAASLVVVGESLRRVRIERDRALHALNESEEIVEQIRRSYFTALPGHLGPDARVRDMLVDAGKRVLRGPPQSPLVRAQIAQSIAEPLYELGGREETDLAERLATMAVEGFRTEIASGNDPTHRRAALAFEALSTLASINYADLRPKEAKALFEEALALAKRVNDRGLIVSSRLRLAGIDEQMLDFERSLEERRAVLALLGDEPEGRRKGVLVRSLLLQNLIELDRPEEAIAEAKIVIESRLADARPADPTLIAVRNCQGWALTNAGRVKEAIDILVPNTADGERIMGAGSPNVCAARVLLARARVLEAPTAENAGALRSLLDELGSKDDTMAAVALAWRPILVECLIKSGQREAAATEARSFLQSAAASPASRASAEYHVGRALHEGGLKTECIGPLESAYQQLVLGPGASSWICRRIAGMLADAHGALGHADRAADWKSRTSQ